MAVSGRCGVQGCSHLDTLARHAHLPESQTAGRPLAARGFPTLLEESPGSTEMRCRLTAGGGDPRDSATENKPPVQGPQFPAGKGETVRQERTAPLATGAAGQTPPGARPNRGGRRANPAQAGRVPQGHFRPAARVGRVRRAVRRVPEEWSSPARKDRDRTRLTGRLVFFCAKSCTSPRPHPITQRAYNAVHGQVGARTGAKLRSKPFSLVSSCCY